MLSIEIGKAYYNKELFIENSYLHLKTGAITTFTNDYHIVTKALSYENSYAVKYVVHDVEVSQLSLEERKEFFRKHIGIVRENPSFIYDLNILGHIEFQKVLFSVDDCSQWIDFLDLSQCLNLYPHELNDFQTFSFSLLLELIKNPQVLILEYFEDQLDYLQTQMIMNTLRAFCNQDKIVILSSNNSQVISLSDEAYEVNKKHCVYLKRMQNVEFRNQFMNLSFTPNFKHIARKFSSIKHKHHIFQQLAQIFLAIALALVAFCTNYDKGNQKIALTYTQEIRYGGIYVYKPYKRTNYSFSLIDALSPKYVISDEEIAQLSEINHVESVEWSYDYMLDYCVPLNEFESSQTTVCFRSGEQVIWQNTDNQGFSHNIYVSSFIPNKDYEEFIENKFQEEGVYISLELANYLSNNKEISCFQDATITFDMYVPVYNSNGRIPYYASDNSVFYPDVTSVVVERVTLPIAGIMGTMNNRDQEVIYFERDVLEEMMDKYKADDSREVYVLNDGTIVEKMPEDGEYSRVASDKPWRPLGYVVYVDDVNYMPDVVSDLIDLGFSVSNATFIMEDPIYTNDISKELFWAIIGVGTISSILIYVLLSIRKMKTQKNINTYLINMNFTKKQVLELKQNLYLLHSKHQVLIAMLALLINVLVWNTILKWGYTDLSLSMFVIIIVLSILFEFIIPYLCDRATILKK